MSNPNYLEPRFDDSAVGSNSNQSELSQLRAEVERLTKERKGMPTVVCLCGSSKWPDIHMRAMMDETLAGRIVIPMGLYGHADFPRGAKAATNDGDESTAVKQMLDTLHHRKIDVADEILVITVGGYIGSSTKREIEYAKATGKKVRFLDCGGEQPSEMDSLRAQLAEREEDRAAAVREASIERERAGSIKAQNIYLHGLVLKLEAVIKEAWDSAECGYILDAETHQCGMCNGGAVPRTQDVPHDKGCFQAILEPAFAIRAARAPEDGK